MIDAKIKVHCTDNGKDFDMHVLTFKEKAYLDVAFETLKIRMVYKANTHAYVGSLGGREFVIKENNLPNENKQYSR
jgi:hypothetical protein